MPPVRSFRALPGIALATVAAVVLSACGGPRLAADPPRAAELGGTWRLDAAASDDADAIIAAAVPKPRRAPSRPLLPDPPSRTDAGSALPPRGATPRPEPEFGRGGAATFARAFAAPATTLRIGGSPREVLVDQDGRRRRFVPGDETPHSVTDRFGTRTVRAGWERDEFVVVSRNSSGFELVERFRRGAAPDTLATNVTLKARGLDPIRVQSLYRRAPDVLPTPSAAEGPPAPVR